MTGYPTPIETECKCICCGIKLTVYNQMDIFVEAVGCETVAEYGPFCPTCCHRIEKAIKKQIEAPL